MHDYLNGLSLYQNDPKLQKRINFLILEWEKLFPHVDIKSQIAWAYSWEISQGPNRYKKDRARFLGNWIVEAERRRTERRTAEHKTEHYVEQKPLNEDDVMTGEDFTKMKEAIRESKRKNSAGAA